MYENKNIFLDFDGVILDSEKRVVDLKNQKPDQSWDEFFQELDWESFLTFCVEIDESLFVLTELQKRKRKISILTKTHTLLEQIAKIEYLRNKKIYFPILCVPPHVKKCQVYLPSEDDLLIDDSLKNIMEWKAAGGQGILFSEQNDIDLCDNVEVVKSLKMLLK